MFKGLRERIKFTFIFLFQNYISSIQARYDLVLRKNNIFISPKKSLTRAANVAMRIVQLLYKLWGSAMTTRISALEKILMNNTVLENWFSPIKSALEKVRYSDNKFRAMGMLPFILQNCFRQLSETKTLRAHVQSLFHLDENATQLPLARATYSDALASKSRLDILDQTASHVVRSSASSLPDRLSSISALGNRPVYAMDGMYQEESSHFRKITPSEGGTDSAKGHLHLMVFDLRIGIPIHIDVDTSSISEIRFVKEEWRGSHLTCEKNALWVVDRGFIDADYWDKRNDSYGVTMITRMKSNLNYTVDKTNKVTCSNKKQGIKSDQIIKLESSDKLWRLIGYQSDTGVYYEYLTNEMDLPSGVVAFMYHRRWDEEKYFDNYKNDLCGAKAWGKTRIAILQQAIIGMLTFILTRLFSDKHAKEFDLDTNGNTQKRKHELKQEKYTEGKIKDHLRAYHTNLSKITRQVWRFLKACMLYKSREKLYQSQLKPMMSSYL